MKTKKIRSAIPIYLFAAGFLLYGLLFPLYLPLHLLLALAVGAVAYFVSARLIPPKEVELPEEPKLSGDEAADTLILDGRQSIQKLREMNARIPDEQLSKQIDRMENAAAAIFKVVAEKPQKAPQIRRFMKYYLPTTLNLLDTYQKLLATGSHFTNVQKSMRSIENSMEMIAQAFEKQLDALYEDQAMNIDADIEVLQTMLRAEGLASEKTPK